MYKKSDLLVSTCSKSKGAMFRMLLNIAHGCFKHNECFCTSQNVTTRTKPATREPTGSPNFENSCRKYFRQPEVMSRYQTSLKPIAMGLSKMGVLSEPIAMGLSKMGVLSECSSLPLWQFTCPLHAQTVLRYRLRQCSDSSTQQAASIVMHQIMQQQQRVSAFICTTFQRRCHWGDHTYTSARLRCWNIS